MIKIRSITDVITNSSTEVWMIRTSILQEAKEKFKDSSWREMAFNRERKENLYEYFIDFPDLESIVDNRNSRVVCHLLPDELWYLLKPFKLTYEQVWVLKEFGHSPDDIKAYVDLMNEDREAKIKEKEEEFKKYYGWSVAIFYDHIQMWGGDEAGKRLISWLRENYESGEDWFYDF